MPTPIREQALAAFEAALIAGLTAIPVERNRSRAIPEDAAKYVLVFDGPQIKVSDETGVDVYRMTVSVEGYIRVKGDALAGPALNELYADVVVAATADLTLGGIAVDVREGNMPDAYIDPDATLATMAFELEFEIDYMTKQDDPYTLGP